MTSPFAHLKPLPPDPLLALIEEFARDPRPAKMGLGIGVYRDETGITPVMRAVKAAERRLNETQATKSYLGAEGDVRFAELLQPLVFGASLSAGGRLSGIQTPGGTGALRLAADLIAAAKTSAKMWVGLPTWPNHYPIFEAAGVPLATYDHLDKARQRVRFAEMMEALERAAPGDVVLLQVSCHNPTGADLGLEQWRAITKLISARSLFPLLDCAYHGLGAGLEEDVAGLRLLLSEVPQALIAYSCDKNFGLYRDRVGALFMVGESASSLGVVRSNILSIARASWSMPPDHGAAVVRLILEDAALTVDWRSELDLMRRRIREIRLRLAALDDSLAPIAQQNGMFSTLDIAPAEVARLKQEHAIYMAGSGRVNLAGLKLSDAERFVAALRAAGAL